MRADVPVPLGDVLLFFVGCAVAVVFGVLVARHSDSPRAVPVESPAHAGCVDLVLHTMYACPDGRAYTVDRQGWHDVGPLSPMPQVPRS